MKKDARNIIVQHLATQLGLASHLVHVTGTGIDSTCSLLYLI